MAKTSATTRPSGKKQRTRNRSESLTAKDRRPKPKATLVEYLALLEAYYQPELSELPWASEDDRWAEFVFCVLYEASGREDAALARNAVVTLRYLGLIDMGVLSGISGPDKDDQTAAAIREILKRHNFDDPEAVAEGLGDLAKRIEMEWGKIQVFLYNEGQSLLDKLADTLASDDVARETLRSAGSLWLQNTMNFPVMVDHPAVASLLRRYRATVEQLMDAADELGLNLAIVDDLIQLADKDTDFETWLEETTSAYNTAAST